MVLWKLTLKSMSHRPVRALLTLISIVIGVAAVIAVMLSAQSTRLAQQALYETVTGRAGLEITADDGGAFSANLISVLDDAPGIKAVVPMIQKNPLLYFTDPRAKKEKAAKTAKQDGGKNNVGNNDRAPKPKDGAPGIKEAKVTLLGVDPARHDAVHDHEIVEGQALGETDGVLLDVTLAGQLGARIGDQVEFSTMSGFRTATVLGLYKPRGVTAASHSSVMFMPLKMAQRIHRQRNQVDRVLLVLKEGMTIDEALAAVTPRLPEGVNVHRPTSHSQVADSNAMAIELGLKMAFWFALLVAAFVILNTFLMNLGERAKQLAIMRAVGATRRQIVWLLLREAAALGILGGLIGAVAGLYGARFLKQGMERLYQTTLPDVETTWQPFLLAAGIGLAVSLIGAVVPAWRAGRLTPLEGMKGVDRSMEGVPTWVWLAGVPLFVIAAAGLTASYFGYVPLMVGIFMGNVGLIGIVLLLAPLLRPMSQVAVRLMRPLLHMEARLAQRQVLRHRARTMLTMGVIFIAISTGIALATAVLDNVNNVQDWYRKTIQADFFIWTMMPGTSSDSTTVPDSLGPEIRKVEGITGIDALRWHSLRVEGLPGVVVIAREFPSDDFVNFDTRGGEAGVLRRRMIEGEVVIGSVLAQKLGKSKGDHLTFSTQKSGTKDLHIADVTNDYRAGGLVVYMQLAVARELLGIEGIDEYIIKADPARRAEVEAALTAICQSQGVSLHSLAEIVNMIDGMVSGLVVGLIGLMVLGFVVAASGVVNTLTMNVLEQTRELGLLRVVGMTRWQIRKMILAQGLLLGGLAIVPGLLSGLGVAWVINVATLPAIGHPIEFGIHPALLIGVPALALVTAAIAAFLPAERAARMAPSSCLQYE